MNVLYKDVIPVTAIKKKDPETIPVHVSPMYSPEEDEREKLRKQCQGQRFTFTENEIVDDAPLPSAPLPAPQQIMKANPLPSISHTLMKNSPEIPAIPADGSQTERDLLKADIQNRGFSMLLGEDDSLNLDDLHLEGGIIDQNREWRGVNDISDGSEALHGVSGMFEKKERGGFLQPNEDEHAHNVMELRRYQREESIWGNENCDEMVHGDVYVIDDADRVLKEESSERELSSSRPSVLTVMSEESDRSIPEVVMVKPKKSQPRKKKEYVGRSKESILIMQDIDGLADLTEDEEEEECTPEHNVRLSPHSTLLPSVVSMSSSHCNSLKSNGSNSESARVSPITDRRQDLLAHPFTQKHNNM